ncbi:mobilization protein [uncultured Chitinophaga sp.]|jgi:hypothetical protein|uniref:plasmid mobilization protein n=1 Tax=uncultured Chitinophaga sp. TaxID=339340 RepID=UPI00260CAA9C|nr:mobilization protein [uncultured Chitinophaga sp.]
MEKANKPIRNKGGRPKKELTKGQRIPIKCTSYEKMVIKAKAKKAGFTVSEYLLQLGLNGQVDSKVKMLPKEVLALTGTLNHNAANLNQLAKKHNSVTDVLTLLDRLDLLTLCKELKDLVTLVKNYLQ